MNFIIQDLVGSSLAFLIFPSILLFPGYVIGWLFDLFEFKRRKILTRYIIAIIVSIAVVPVIVYLISLLTSVDVVKLVLVIIFVSYILIIVEEYKKKTEGDKSRPELTRHQRLAFFVAAGWVSLSIISLVDFQLGDRLYNNAVSLDFATRVTMVNAITRTGVPPVNPSFFPGHPEYTTSVYYFWYILCSVVDQFGGDFVDSRMALIAGDAWCGLALMSLIALYLKFRNSMAGEKLWKTAILGISFLAISGLDVVPALANMLVTRFTYGFMWPPGDVEHWNEQITAWVGSLLWVPHHVTAMIACMTGFIIFQYYRNNPPKKSISIMIIAGLAFASAVGLSTWVTITFSLFLGGWGFILLIQNKDKDLIILMAFAGLIALLSASPFLLGILKGGTGASGLPVALEVRRFIPVSSYIAGFPIIPKNVVYFVLLPVNYLMELGFFLVIGVIWFQKYRQKNFPDNPFYIPELILLCVVFLVCSFVRSAIIANDLGWRGWLPGQFILLIWAVDLYDIFPFLNHTSPIKIVSHSLIAARTAKLLAFLWWIGLCTSVVDVALLRFFPLLVDANITGFPNRLSPDTQLGGRTFDGRLAYEFIGDNLPANIVIQQNPLSVIDRIDRPSGLYGNRQFAISFNAAYNVPPSVLDFKSNEISKIFALSLENSWDKIDLLCQKHFIDVLVVADQDPLWKDLPILYQQRAALYENRYYAVISCGDFVLLNDYP